MEKSEKKVRVKFHSGKEIPLEMHKVRVVQKLNLLPIEQRKKAMEEAGFNTREVHSLPYVLGILPGFGGHGQGRQDDRLRL